VFHIIWNALPDDVEWMCILANTPAVVAKLICITLLLVSQCLFSCSVIF
jgi:hypothetical protein